MLRSLPLRSCRPAARWSIAALTLWAIAPGCARAPLRATADGSVARAAAGGAANQLTDAERDAGWSLLFDGSTLRGWRGLAASEVPATHWVVENGAIRKVASGKVPVQADGQPLQGGDLISEGTYRDFELSWEWKVTPGANSGVKYNVSEELSAVIAPTHAAKGFEYQMIDDDRHADGKLPTHRSGALYDLIAPPENKPLRPVGEWNASRIVLAGGRGEHWLNGVKVVSYELGTARMDSLLMASKYRSWPWFADRRAGHIVLQDHGDDVYFRNIKIRPLPAGR
ncbi:MAG TPA: DUF1080 domain-containing protein [Gemmatimonadaceae bacterium]|nr:DUF1080 domain-containing protein [Gemmatimonadaceae bacterium]